MSEPSSEVTDSTHTSRKPIYQKETTGSYMGDVKEAAKRIGEIPCARNSLLSGIASGAGIGVIRGMTAGAFVASNWAVGTFLLVSAGTWTICQKAREDERRKVQQVVEQMPKRFAKQQETSPDAPGITSA
ncbi:hypothetical protein NLI96_g3510 [Meripilus lineatus]|uniref:Cytochrome c oxidase assembly protein COX20, mitochondrial n=1 Tax=Meripilus lineatus TaxID=2056292 RepID=A0AAD5V834_9APHY|nr:hypothetical protein NLI96_g3510 [Physisporinus lineatus]